MILKKWRWKVTGDEKDEDATSAVDNEGGADADSGSNTKDDFERLVPVPILPL